MQGDQSGIDLPKILEILATLLAGGLAVYFGYWLKNRVPIIGIKQYISQVVDPEMLIKPQIVFESNHQEFRYSNLFIVETHIFNKSKKSFKNFDLKIGTSVPADIIFVSCNGEDESHEAVLTHVIDFENPAKSIDLDLNPFNINNKYSLSLYVACLENHKLTKNDIRYSTKNNSIFRSVNGL
jgi:hypothetical protein